MDDNPLEIDRSTNALEKLIPSSEDNLVEDILYAQLGPTKKKQYDEKAVKSVTLPYRELYYSFHHPYFVGYVLFWTFLFHLNATYLGIVNFSFN
jgi:hypothetical protein